MELTYQRTVQQLLYELLTTLQRCLSNASYITPTEDGLLLDKTMLSSCLWLKHTPRFKEFPERRRSGKKQSKGKPQLPPTKSQVHTEATSQQQSGPSRCSETCGASEQFLNGTIWMSCIYCSRHQSPSLPYQSTTQQQTGNSTLTTSLTAHSRPAS